MQGVEKVMYLPTEAMNNPLSFFTFANGNIPGTNLLKDMKTAPK